MAVRKKRNVVKEVFNPITSTIKVTSYHEFLGHAFLGDYKTNTKINKFNSIDRCFDKGKSVFKDWKLDVPEPIGEGFLEEIEYWKI